MKLSDFKNGSVSAKISPEFDSMTEKEKQELINPRTNLSDLEIISSPPTKTEKLLSESNVLSEDKRALLREANNIAENALSLAREAEKDATSARRRANFANFIAVFAILISVKEEIFKLISFILN